MATGALDNPYVDEGNREAPVTGNPTQPPPPYSRQPDNRNPDIPESGKPAVPSESYWNPQQPGYAGFPVPDAGYVNNPDGFNTNDDAMLIPETIDDVAILRERESFVKQIVFSCVVFWVFCWPLGLTAFILAMLANSKSKEPDETSQTESHILGIHSCRTSIAGVIIGIIVIVVVVTVQLTYYHQHHP